MRLKGFGLVVILFLVIFEMVAENPIQHYAYNSKSGHINVDSLLHVAMSVDTIPKPKINPKHRRLNFRQLLKLSELQTAENQKKLQTAVQPKDSIVHFSLPTNIQPVKVDSLLLLANPFFIELVYNGEPINLDEGTKIRLKKQIYGTEQVKFHTLQQQNQLSADEIIEQLRDSARKIITQKSANLYIMTFDELPDPNVNWSGRFIKKSISNLEFSHNERFDYNRRRIQIKNAQLGPWQYKANALAQFSESLVSANWYQGGNSNLAVLGILSAQLTYDDKKNIQWDNNTEWRLGFNSIAGDTIHWLSTNDDVLKISSKLGIKASGNFFYSGSVDFSTQFFNSYKGINSYVLKASFLAPVRLNIGLGLDYKYKKIFSLMVSPFSYKYIFVNPVLEPFTKIPIDQNLFGVKTGQNVLSEIGSLVKITYSDQITKEIQLDSKFSFYTNYQKVEIDWEIVANMSINRFLSTRISLNPRYDNTVIEKDGLHAYPQFKQFLSVGFSHKFI